LDIGLLYVICFLEISMRTTINELFYILTGAVVLFSALELVWPGVVLSYFNLNWLLIFWLIVGIVLLVISEKK